MPSPTDLPGVLCSHHLKKMVKGGRKEYRQFLHSPQPARAGFGDGRDGIKMQKGRVLQWTSRRQLDKAWRER